MSSSFSLPSASGMVSLLNDGNQSKDTVDITNSNQSEMGLRPPLPYRNGSSSSSSSVTSTLGNSLLGESNSNTGGSKSSLSSTLTSQSSDSLQSSKIGEIPSLERLLEGQDIHSVNENGSREDYSRNSSEISIENTDEDEMREIAKKRKSEDSLVNSNQRSQRKEKEEVLHQKRLAASPKPMGSSASPTDVPMNMHNATSRSDHQTTRNGVGGGGGLGEDGRKVIASGGGGGGGAGSGKRRYPCSHAGCDKTFSTSGHAARHNRIHTGSKPYRCTFPGCNASFSRQDNPLQHYRTHVLHPKSRGGAGSSSLVDGSSSFDPSMKRDITIDSHLQGLDAETEATVRLGRKALEEGTAIAVVHEVVDGNGRKGEAVQRMVGQPRSNRRSSNSTSISDLKDRESFLHGQIDDMEDDDDQMSVNTSRSYGASLRAPLPHKYTYATSPSTMVHGEAPNYPPYHHAATYPPVPVATKIPSPSSRSNSYMNNNSTYRSFGYSQSPTMATSPWHQHPPTSLDCTSPSNKHNPYDKTGRCSEGTYQSYPPNLEASNRSAPVNSSFSYSLNQSPANDQASRLNVATSMMDHKRSRSLNTDQAARTRRDWEYERRQIRDESSGVDASPPANSSHRGYIKDERDALSLLPPNSSSMSNGGPLPPLSNMISSPQHQTSMKRMRSQSGLIDLHLPLPSTLSKVPYSSDRSTSNQSTNKATSANPSLDKLILQRGIPTSNQASPFHNIDRTLPPMRDVQQHIT